MKRYVSVALAALVLIAIPAVTGCKPTENIDDPPPCTSSFFQISGNFIGDLKITDAASGGIIYDGRANVRTYQSGGAGTYWAGAIGTAKTDLVLVDAAWNVGGYAITLIGTATDTEGTFDDTVVNDTTDGGFHYEFRNVTPVASAINSSEVPLLDFRLLPDTPLLFE